MDSNPQPFDDEVGILPLCNNTWPKGASNSGWIRTTNLVITRLVLHHCAVAASKSLCNNIFFYFACFSFLVSAEAARLKPATLDDGASVLRLCCHRWPKLCVIKLYTTAKLVRFCHPATLAPVWYRAYHLLLHSCS
jgi:hypothetical protein